jgi:hypothetical protein
MTLVQAAKGFTSESQFLAALHASKDLNIPFAQIKAEMTGRDHDRDPWRGSGAGAFGRGEPDAVRPAD